MLKSCRLRVFGTHGQFGESRMYEALVSTDLLVRRLGSRLLQVEMGYRRSGTAQIERYVGFCEQYIFNLLLRSCEKCV
jgi:hypothetical protein